MLAKFWSSSGHKMIENCGFRRLSEKVFMHSNSHLVCTLIGWVSRIDSLLGQVGRNLALWWPQNYLDWWFLTVIGKIIHTIHFELDVYTCWMSVHNWSAFGPRWPNFAPLVAPKWIKLGENGYFRQPTAYLSTQPNWFLMCTLIWWVFINDSLFLTHMLNLAPIVPIDVFPLSLIRPQAGTWLPWCLVLG